MGDRPRRRGVLLCVHLVHRDCSPHRAFSFETNLSGDENGWMRWQDRRREWERRTRCKVGYLFPFTLRASGAVCVGGFRVGHSQSFQRLELECRCAGASARATLQPICHTPCHTCYLSTPACHVSPKVLHQSVQKGSTLDRQNAPSLHLALS
jgi:hypothetical protein